MKKKLVRKTRKGVKNGKQSGTFEQRAIEFARKYKPGPPRKSDWHHD